MQADEAEEEEEVGEQSSVAALRLHGLRIAQKVLSPQLVDTNVAVYTFTISPDHAPGTSDMRSDPWNPKLTSRPTDPPAHWDVCPPAS